MPLSLDLDSRVEVTEGDAKDQVARAHVVCALPRAPGRIRTCAPRSGGLK